MAAKKEIFQYAVALTGGIATGKSSVSELFLAEGFCVIDADQIAHQVLEREAFQVAALFGEDILRQGKVDRKALGSIVFNHTEARRALEALLHPLIYDEILYLSTIEDKKRKPYLVDIPLFFETARYNIDRTIVVYATRAQQIERAMKRDKASAEEVLRRIEAQIDIEKKKAKADYLIDNSGHKDRLYTQSLAVMNEIRKDFL